MCLSLSAWFQFHGPKKAFSLCSELSGPKNRAHLLHLGMVEGWPENLTFTGFPREFPGNL